MLELPVLDDKRYRQMVQEGIAQIPTLSGAWTDHNPSDTGIMLLELLAAMTEMQRFYLDQVGERFYEQYLALTVPDVQGSPAERREVFARRCSEPGCAVTAQDYERLARRSPYGIDFARAEFQSPAVLLTVFRENKPLGDAELIGLRRYLEPCRLLGVRLRIRQALRVPVEVECKLRVKPGLVRTGLCKQAVREVLESCLHGREPGRILESAPLREKLFAVEGVAGIERLSLRLIGSHGVKIDPAQSFLRVQEIRIELIERA